MYEHIEGYSTCKNKTIQKDGTIDSMTLTRQTLVCEHSHAYIKLLLEKKAKIENTLAKTEK